MLIAEMNLNVGPKSAAQIHPWMKQPWIKPEAIILAVNFWLTLG
jgi:hypothetical protein